MSQEKVEESVEIDPDFIPTEEDKKLHRERQRRKLCERQKKEQLKRWWEAEQRKRKGKGGAIGLQTRNTFVDEAVSKASSSPAPYLTVSLPAVEGQSGGTWHRGAMPRVLSSDSKCTPLFSSHHSAVQPRVKGGSIPQAVRKT